MKLIKLLNKQKNKIIKTVLETTVTISFKDNNNILSTINGKKMAQLLIVSEVIINYNNNEWTINVKTKIGTKCPRCWLIVNETKKDVCNRCFEVLSLTM